MYFRLLLYLPPKEFQTEIPQSFSLCFKFKYLHFLISSEIHFFVICTARRYAIRVFILAINDVYFEYIRENAPRIFFELNSNSSSCYVFILPFSIIYNSDLRVICNSNDTRVTEMLNDGGLSLHECNTAIPLYSVIRR